MTYLCFRQEQSTGNWWLLLLNHTKVGYWPKEIFTHLATGASSARYGAAVYSPPSISSPVPMGYGVMPYKAFNQACFFAHIQIVNAENQMVDIDPSKVDHFAHDKNQCYHLVYFDDLGPDVGQAFIMGGPGGYKCPDSI